ncbi:CrcB protein [Streptoalloteichus tenebrarius]|uniref:Fluoride-specific ion channel FluC n=1 Tax=Streptoalloteichus tenebrarius (strain ATCC 17920 / DSM 40477 / JCM 4838 / CBS 697.72 / NBRC 16177 / NCIMB 11028 / NRRL B-12390 / A12253. 1 / ISP 5477) TaxID=1933 RepID=A0ABT1HVF3_STRSD|nr:fluoride efflux transporter CrcB [Streptoalloteichus tenebrarius]MCP2259447.1 CrcB protein [Streptoalloteichus tenebrarius]BFF02389.1 fluoride efflux transporter CrcB [Streptoalloteichus tenebrarius]
MSALLVVLGAAVGAPLRYLTDLWARDRFDAVFPWGTFLVNVVGSFVLGVVSGLALAGGAGEAVQALVGVGFCGALTTYSTFGYETVRLLEEGARRDALLNAAGSVLAGLASAVAGVALGQAF